MAINLWESGEYGKHELWKYVYLYLKWWLYITPIGNGICLSSVKMENIKKSYILISTSYFFAEKLSHFSGKNNKKVYCLYCPKSLHLS